MKRQSPASYSTPVAWDTPDGNQVAVAGHARLIGYDLKSGSEKWFVSGIPAGCCSSPVTADGLLLFAGLSPGGTEDGKAKAPTFDDLLKELDKDNDGAISREEGEKAYQGFFNNQDANKDGKITRDEAEMIAKFMSEGKSSAFALKPGGSGDVTETHKLWNKTKGLAYVSSALAYRGQYVTVKDGGIVTAFDMQTGDEVYQKRAVATGTYYASPVAARASFHDINQIFFQLDHPNPARRVVGITQVVYPRAWDGRIVRHIGIVQQQSAVLGATDHVQSLLERFLRRTAGTHNQ